MQWGDWSFWSVGKNSRVGIGRNGWLITGETVIMVVMNMVMVMVSVVVTSLRRSILLGTCRIEILVVLETSWLWVLPTGIRDPRFLVLKTNALL